MNPKLSETSGITLAGIWFAGFGLGFCAYQSWETVSHWFSQLSLVRSSEVEEDQAEEAGVFIHETPFFPKDGKVPPITNTLHVIFIRHAESENNVLSESLTAQYKESVYQNGTAAKAAYDQIRLEDPDISPFGKQQLRNIPEHAYIKERCLKKLARKNRVQVFCSPMLRALKTAQAVSSHIGVERVKVLPELCEHGGIFSSEGDVDTQQDGMTFKEITSKFPEYDVSAVQDSEVGWWKQYAVGQTGRETMTFFSARIKSVVSMLRKKTLALEKAIKAGTEIPPDYFVIVSHADFMNAILTEILQLPVDFDHYTFYHSNTSCSHVEFHAKHSGEIICRIKACNASPKLIIR